MKIDPDFVTLASLQRHWSTEQRHKYFLLEPEQALSFLIRSTGKNYGDNLIKWSLYYLFQEKKDIGIKVIIGTFTGKNKRRLQSYNDLLEKISKG